MGEPVAALIPRSPTRPACNRVSRSLRQTRLAPADLRKEGPAYDLPIAVGVLLASGQVLADVEDAVFIGELGLNGDVRPVRGLLPMVMLAANRGAKRAFVPAENAPEAGLVDGMTILPVTSLASLAAHLLGPVPIDPYQRGDAPDDGPANPSVTDFADIVGQEHVKRALEVARSIEGVVKAEIR